MKRFLYCMIGAVLGAALCVGITWGIGQIFGQLYQGEEEANRNFGFFMLAFVLFFLGGGVIGFMVGKKRQ